MIIKRRTKTFAIGATISGVGQAAKAAFGKGVMTNLKFSGGMAAAGLAANHYINYDRKKNGMVQNAETGQYEYKNKQYSVPVPNPAGATLKANEKGLGRKILGHAGEVVSTTVMGAGMPLLEHSIKKNQLRAAQKQYGIVSGITAFGKSIANTYKKEGLKGLGKKTVSGASNFATFGIANNANTSKFAEELIKNGGKQAKVGNWIGNHKTLTTAGTAVAGVGAMGLMDKGFNKAKDALSPKDTIVNNNSGRV